MRPALFRGVVDSPLDPLRNGILAPRRVDLYGTGRDLPAIHPKPLQLGPSKLFHYDVEEHAVGLAVLHQNHERSMGEPICQPCRLGVEHFYSLHVRSSAIVRNAGWLGHCAHQHFFSRCARPLVPGRFLKQVYVRNVHPMHFIGKPIDKAVDEAVYAVIAIQHGSVNDEPHTRSPELGRRRCARLRAATS